MLRSASWSFNGCQAPSLRYWFLSSLQEWRSPNSRELIKPSLEDRIRVEQISFGALSILRTKDTDTSKILCQATQNASSGSAKYCPKSCLKAILRDDIRWKCGFCFSETYRPERATDKVLLQGKPTLFPVSNFRVLPVFCLSFYATPVSPIVKRWY
jgi:hypothetical protein